MRTRLTELLGIEHPVMLAGMGGVSYAVLTAAVSEAGGIGCLGASTMGPNGMVAEMRKVKELTSKPFGVDLLTPMPGDLERQVGMLIDEGATMFVAALGVPATVIKLCHDAGLVVVNMCGKVDHARRAVDAGCDLVVAQGTEAGGHTGTIATMPLVPQIVDAVGAQVPVVAAGGIFDGRGLAAALALGADGVWIGTRFIATPEARAVPGYKEALLASREDGTVVSRAYSGKTMRVLRNDYTAYFEAHPDELQPFPGQLGRAFQDGALHLGGEDATVDIDLTRECFPAGQGTGALSGLTPAGDLVRQIVAEAEEVLQHLAPTSHQELTWSANAQELSRPRRRAVSDEDKASRRNDILAAAKEVFAERGYHATTIADIARAAGLSYGSIYWYYESKEALFHELMAAEAATLRAHIDDAVRATPSSESPAAPFKAAVTATLEFYDADKALVKLLFRDAFALGTAFEQHLYSIHASFVDDAARLVEAAQRQGVVAGGPARMLGFAITSLVGQLAHRRLTTDDGLSAAEAADFLVGLLLNGLLIRTGDARVS